MPVPTPVDIRVNPNDDAQFYTLWGTGRIDNEGGALPITDGPTWYDRYDQPVAVALHITDWAGPSGYVFDFAGGIHAFGAAPAIMNTSGDIPVNSNGIPYAYERRYTDWQWNPNGSGQLYAVSFWGELFEGGGALDPVRLGRRFNSPAVKAFKMRWTPDKRGYLLDHYGGLHPEWNAVTPNPPPPYYLGYDVARDFEVTDWDTGAGYLLTADGAAHPFGGASSSLYGGPYRPGADVARQIYVLSAEDPTRIRQVHATGQVIDYVASTPPTVLAGGGQSEQQTITITGSPTGGTFTLTYSGQTTTAIARNATAATVQAALQALSGVGAGNVTVTGGPGPGTPWTVTFTGARRRQDVPQMTATSSLTGGGTNEVQTVTKTGSPTGGTFTLSFGGQTTTAIAYNATAATVQAALQALSTIGAGNVTVTGSAGGPWTVTFTGTLSATNVAQLTGTPSFTGGTSPNLAIATTTAGVPSSIAVTTALPGMASSPAVTVTDTTRPVLSWSPSDAEGDSQAEWRLLVFTEAFAAGHTMTDPSVWAADAVVDESGINPGDRGVRSPIDLGNGSYREYVQVKDTAGQWSPWDVHSWTQAVPVPTAPSGLTATVNPDGTSVALSVTAVTGQAANLVRFEFSDDEQATWWPVPSADAQPLAATTTGTDWFPPQGGTREFRAIAYAVDPAIASPPSNTDDATITTRRHLLHALDAPTIGGQVKVQEPLEWVRDVVAGVFRGLGAKYPIVVRDGSGPKAARATLQLLSLDAATWRMIEDLAEASSTLVYRGPFGDVRFCELVGEWPQRQVRAAPTKAEATPLRHMHTTQLPLVEVAPPYLGG